MDKNYLLQKAKKQGLNSKIMVRSELMGFVRQEFMRLVEKNLKLPIKLFHL